MANGAMLALAQARFGARGGDRLVNDLGMAKRVNALLCDQNLMANGAMLTLAQARFGARGGDRCIRHFGMRYHINVLCFLLTASAIAR